MQTGLVHAAAGGYAAGPATEFRLSAMLDSTQLGRLVRRRTPYQHPDVPFVVLWAQKAGCTSVFKWFLWHAGLLDTAAQYRADEEGLSIHNYETEVFKKPPGYLDRLVTRIEAGVAVVNFLRCPYSRAFSSYMHLHNRFYIRFERDGIRNPGLELRYEILEAVYGYRPPVEYPFSFMDYLQWLDGHEIADIEPHHATQYTPLYALPGVTHYRLEDFDAAVRAIERQYALPDSSGQRTRFSSAHHLAKSPLQGAALAKFLERGVSLSRSPKYLIPEVGREALAGTAYGDLIERIFHRDIALYQSVCP